MLNEKIKIFVDEYLQSRNTKETNVMYLTSRCNFDCEYCFEKVNREKLKVPIDISFKEIDEYLDDIEWREDGLNSTVVFFGGEPLLMLDKIEYTINSMIRRNKNGGWGWDITTNGFLLLNDKIFERVNNLLTLDNKFGIYGNIKISFDVSGQYRRKILPDFRDSFDEIYKVLLKAENFSKGYSISYTITEANVKTYKKDLIWMMSKLKKLNTIVVNIARSDIEKNIWKNTDDYSNFMKELEVFAGALYSKYKIPCCELVCDDCKRCSKTEKSNNYLIPEKRIDIKEEKFIKKEFNKFIEE